MWVSSFAHALALPMQLANTPLLTYTCYIFFTEQKWVRWARIVRTWASVTHNGYWLLIAFLHLQRYFWAIGSTHRERKKNRDIMYTKMGHIFDFIRKSCVIKNQLSKFLFSAYLRIKSKMSPIFVYMLTLFFILSLWSHQTTVE